MLMWCYLRLRRWGGVVWGGVGFGLGWGGQGCNITFMYVADLWCDVDADRFFKGDWRRKQQVQGLHRVNIQSLLIGFITFLIFLDFSKAVFGGIFQRQPDFLLRLIKRTAFCWWWSSRSNLGLGQLPFGNIDSFATLLGPTGTWMDYLLISLIKNISLFQSKPS